jgi:enoyl-CoA hydratase
MKYQNVLLKLDGRIATITLNRPEKLNAINDGMMRDLIKALEKVRKDYESLVVVIKGAGSSFSVGQDLSGVDTDEVMPPNPREKTYLFDMYSQGFKNQSVWQYIFEYPKITVAQVHGYCLGMGLDLAMSCRAVICTDDAVFGDPSVRMGLASANPLWTFRIGLKKSKELLLTGRYIDGKEAQKIGLVMKAVPAAELEQAMTTEVDAVAHSAGIGGWDQQGPFWSSWISYMQQAGLGAARQMTTNVNVMSSIQRPHRSLIDRGGYDFYQVRDEKGLRAAIEGRDAPFRKYFSEPKPKVRK